MAISNTRVPTLDTVDFLKLLDEEDVVTGAGLHLLGEEERKNAMKSLMTSEEVASRSVLVDPLDKLDKPIDEVTVEDLTSALLMTSEEIALLQTMTSGQLNNPLWLDARQWE
jgi:hypothetical protein